METGWRLHNDRYVQFSDFFISTFGFYRSWKNGEKSRPDYCSAPRSDLFITFFLKCTINRRKFCVISFHSRACVRGWIWLLLASFLCGVEYCSKTLLVSSASFTGVCCGFDFPFLRYVLPC